MQTLFPVFFVLFSSSLATLIIQQPDVTTLKDKDIVVYEFKLKDQELLTFSFPLYQGCYVSRIFYYPDKNQRLGIRFINQIPIRLYSTFCPAFEILSHISFEEFFVQVNGITYKHKDFDCFGAHVAVVYGVIDFQNNTAISFAVVKMMNVNKEQQGYLDDFFDPFGKYFHYYLIKLFKIYQVV